MGDGADDALYRADCYEMNHWDEFGREKWDRAMNCIHLRTKLIGDETYDYCDLEDVLCQLEYSGVECDDYEEEEE